MHWYIDVLRQYAVFTGRARRQEYWMFTLINVLVFFVLAGVFSALGLDSNIAGIYILAVLLPSIAVTVRRLHDTNRSAWWLLLFFVPVIGDIVLLVFTVFNGTQGENDYGADPKEVAS
jgi:uncharacterized membrane protein YhaH (DUF805 family)